MVLVTALKRRSGLDSETFYARWHGSHTPLSLEVHPLLHYVRNTVARSLTPEHRKNRLRFWQHVRQPVIGQIPTESPRRGDFKLPVARCAAGRAWARCEVDHWASVGVGA